MDVHPRRLRRAAAARIVCLCAIALLTTVADAPAGADPLDKITGLEELEHTRVVDFEAEWEGWYKARVRWRRALREFQLQRARNARLAKIRRRMRRRHNAAVKARRPRPATQQRGRTPSADKPVVRKPKPPSGTDPFLTPTMDQQKSRQRRQAKPPAQRTDPDDGVEIQ